MQIGRPHPDPVVESASLSAVKPPPPAVELKLPKKIIDEGLLSNIQLESVLLASSRCVVRATGKENERRDLGSGVPSRAS